MLGYLILRRKARMRKVTADQAVDLQRARRPWGLASNLDLLFAPLDAEPWLLNCVAISGGFTFSVGKANDMRQGACSSAQRITKKIGHTLIRTLVGPFETRVGVLAELKGTGCQQRLLATVAGCW